MATSDNFVIGKELTSVDTTFLTGDTAALADLAFGGVAIDIPDNNNNKETGKRKMMKLKDSVNFGHFKELLRNMVSLVSEHIGNFLCDGLAMSGATAGGGSAGWRSRGRTTHGSASASASASATATAQGWLGDNSGSQGTSPAPSDDTPIP